MQNVALWHNHTEYSNLSFRDSINRVEDLIDTALELGLTGIGITEHGNLSSHIKAIKHLKSLKSKATDETTKKQLEDFRIGLGTECYLVDREVVETLKTKNERIRFYHFILIPKNYEGYRALANLSTKSWEQSFFYRGLERVPTYKDDFKEILKSSKGNIVGSTACLGSEFSKLVLDYVNNDTDEIRQAIIDYVEFMKDIFGSDFYIEIQPSFAEEQIAYNQMAIKIARAMDIRVIVTTDAHYLRPEDRKFHDAYLKSQNAERETDSFYATTYLMTAEELKVFFDYLDDVTFNEIIFNTNIIKDSIENFDLAKSTQVPNATIGYDSAFESKMTNIIGLKEHCPYIDKYLHSEYEVDRVLLQQIEKGMELRNQAYDATNLLRINEELGSLWEISEKLNQRLSAYYVLTQEIVDLMWSTSLVGVSRGSAGAFYICYLTGITQINPITMNDLPAWRHISAERPELPKQYWAV